MPLSIARSIGKLLARHLSQPSGRPLRSATSSPSLLSATLRRGDILLVEGNTRFSTAIKYLTHSNWSHSALCIADPDEADRDPDAPRLVEAEINEGVRLTPLSRYDKMHTRICRPVGLEPETIGVVIQFCLDRLGNQYDLKNIVDLARYLIPKPPVPKRWRRQLLAFGSGDPTRAICSSLIAEAFQNISYPILPEKSCEPVLPGEDDAVQRECLRIRHHSLYAPSDFDLSPYFEIVKPTIAQGFDYTKLTWCSLLPPR